MNTANSKFLNNNKSPLRKAGQLDTRGSHFYLAMYWAQALAEQNEDKVLQAKFTSIAQQLTDNETKIITELNSVQGQAVNIGGYYRPDQQLTEKVMRPSESFNHIIESL